VSKKRFTSSWDDLFADTASDEQLQEEESLLALPDRRKPKKADTKAVRSSGKNFSDSLDLFLQEAMETEGQTEATIEIPTRLTQRKMRRSGGGLNSLIKETLPNADHTALPKENTRRLTLLLSREEMDRLRLMAKEQKLPLRELVLDIIADFLRAQGPHDPE
jgi:hypothetical protein